MALAGPGPAPDVSFTFQGAAPAEPDTSGQPDGPGMWWLNGRPVEPYAETGMVLVCNPTGALGPGDPWPLVCDDDDWSGRYSPGDPAQD